MRRLLVGVLFLLGAGPFSAAAAQGPIPLECIDDEGVIALLEYLDGTRERTTENSYYECVHEGEAYEVTAGHAAWAVAALGGAYEDYWLQTPRRFGFECGQYPSLTSGRQGEFNSAAGVPENDRRPCVGERRLVDTSQWQAVLIYPGTAGMVRRSSISNSEGAHMQNFAAFQFEFDAARIFFDRISRAYQRYAPWYKDAFLVQFQLALTGGFTAVPGPVPVNPDIPPPGGGGGGGLVPTCEDGSTPDPATGLCADGSAPAYRIVEDRPHDDVTSCWVLDIPCNFRRLFVPQKTLVERAGEVLDVLEHKPPLGYVAWRDSVQGEFDDVLHSRVTGDAACNVLELGYELPEPIPTYSPDSGWSQLQRLEFNLCDSAFVQEYRANWRELVGALLVVFVALGAVRLAAS